MVDEGMAEKGNKLEWLRCPLGGNRESGLAAVHTGPGFDGERACNRCAVSLVSFGKYGRTSVLCA